jgi:EAL domain-containing protein (putative c-di-GMP-specific phosphodiesterase class I)
VRQFLQSDFEIRLLRTLNKYDVAPTQLELELTETLLINDTATMSALLLRLRTAGFSLSLDDFGTGHSSLSYLSHFNLNTVKIDRSFVMALESSSRNQSLVQAIIRMGHSLGLEVVAEGVETTGQRDFLRAQDCDYLQGYLIGKPGPPSDCLRLPLTA